MSEEAIPPDPVPAAIPEPPPPAQEPAQEVEAVPASAADRSGPTIEVEPPREPPVIPAAPTPRPTWRDHAWAAICHLMLFLAIPTVFLGGVVTFFLWQLKGKDDAQVEDQGREALNFQINVAVLTAVLSITFLGVALVPIVWLVAAIFCIIAARKAAEGSLYRYPWILRVVTH